MGCPWCGEEVLDDEAYDLEAYGPPGTIHHRECWIRKILGSVGRQLGLRFGRGAEEGDPPGYTRRQAAAAASKLAVDLAALPEVTRGLAEADAREKVWLLGADVLFAWRPGVAAN